MKYSFKSHLFIIVLILEILCINNSFADIEDNSPNNIQKILIERIDKEYTVGITVAIIDQKGIRFYNAGKTSKQPGAQNINQDTLFPIASITKVFTTLLLADGIQSGIFKLYDPAQKYLPYIKLPIYQNTEITLEQLATHTSGLPADISSYKYDDPYAHFTPKTFYQLVSAYKLTRQPGKQFEYTDIGMGILANIISYQEKIPYEKLLADKITRPLGMNLSRIIISPDNMNIITGYNLVDRATLPIHFPILESAGAMYSTSSDLAKFIAANLGLKKTDLYSAMQLTHLPRHSEGNPTTNFDYPGLEQLDIGLGWNIDRTYRIIWKNGNMPGYSSLIGFDPTTKRGIVVLTNTGNVVYTDNLGLHLLNPQIPLLPLYKEIYVSSNILKSYSGKYAVSDGTFYIFETENHHLKVRHITSSHISPYFNIYAFSKNKFFGKVDDATFIFSNNNTNPEFILIESGKKLRGVKIASDKQ